MGYGGIINTITDPFGLGNSSAPSTPNPSKISQQYQQLIQGYAAGQPTIFGAEQTYKPQYTALDLSQLATAFPAIQSLMASGAPGAAATVAGINPQQTALLNNMDQSAESQLAAGSSLSPDQTRLFQQSVRGAQAARGLGYGPSDVFNESLGLTQFGNQLLQQRQAYAGNVAGMENQYETQPSLQLLTQMLTPAAGVAQNSGPTIIPAGQTYDMFNTAYNAKAAANIAGANNAAAANNSY